MSAAAHWPAEPAELTLPVAGTLDEGDAVAGELSGRCPTLTLTLGPSRRERLDSTIDWVPLQADGSAVPRPGNPRGNRLRVGLDGGGSGQEVTAC